MTADLPADPIACVVLICKAPDEAARWAAAAPLISWIAAIREEVAVHRAATADENESASRASSDGPSWRPMTAAERAQAYRKRQRERHEASRKPALIVTERHEERDGARDDRHEKRDAAPNIDLSDLEKKESNNGGIDPDPTLPGTDSQTGERVTVRHEPRHEKRDGRVTRKPAKARWKRVPAEWQPTDDHRRIAAEERVNFNRELQRFRDYEFPRAKTDADAAFRNWLRTAGDRNPNGKGGAEPAQKPLHLVELP